jgi:hypothetical protein
MEIPPRAHSAGPRKDQRHRKRDALRGGARRVENGRRVSCRSHARQFQIVNRAPTSPPEISSGEAGARAPDGRADARVPPEVAVNISPFVVSRATSYTPWPPSARTSPRSYADLRAPSRACLVTRRARSTAARQQFTCVRRLIETKVICCARPPSVTQTLPGAITARARCQPTPRSLPAAAIRSSLTYR